MIPKILNAKMDWAEDYDNYPSLKILVDKMPTADDMVYQYKNGIFFAHKEGWVSFYSHNGDELNHGGFGGNSFTINTKKGKKTIKGPSSSRSSVCNKIGFSLSMDVDIVDNKESFNRGYSSSGWSLSLTLLKKIVKKFLPECTILLIIENSEPTLRIALKDGRKKPNPKTYYGKKANNWVVLSEKEINSVMNWNDISEGTIKEML